MPKAVAFALLLSLVAGCASGNRPLQFIGGKDLLYPPQARAAGIEGRVLVRYDVTAEGRVENARVESAVPAGHFEAAALDAVRSWRFRPLLERGEPAAAPNRVSQVAFKLGEDDYDLPVPKQRGAGPPSSKNGSAGSATDLEIPPRDSL